MYILSQFDTIQNFTWRGMVTWAIVANLAAGKVQLVLKLIRASMRSPSREAGLVVQLNSRKGQSEVIF
jgi:hypothetical protein